MNAGACCGRKVSIEMDAIKLMYEQIASQADLFDQCSENLILQCKALVRKDGFAKSLNKIYITGCGDSYFAGICCRDFFRTYVGVHTEVWHALELSRYVLPYEADEHTLVLSVSSSGNVARTAECALRAAQVGAMSVAVTSKPESRLAKLASAAICIEIPDSIALAPGTQSYCASMLALYSIAVALGQERGTITEEKAKSLLAGISGLGRVMKQTAEQSYDLIRKYVDAYWDEGNPQKIRMFHILGSGPNWGTAQFGSMKLLEAAGFDSVPQGIEEWAHAQYFTTRPGTHTLVLAAKGESRERALEILQAVTVMDGKKIVIGEEGDEELARAADIFLPICGAADIPEELSPLVYPIPLELMSCYISALTGKAGFEFAEKPWRKQENFRQIYGSRIVPLDSKEV